MDKHLKDTLDSYENCGFLQQGPMYRKVGPNVLPKPNKAEPQVPVIPKSHTIKKFSEPSFSTVLNRYGHQAGNDTSVSHSTYANFPPPPPPPQVEPLYSNLQNRRFKSRDPSEDDLPPPPLDSSLEPELNHLPPPLPEDLPPPSPPSPVSSSYSELRRATGNEVLSPYGGPYATYAPLSQISIEESVYEPIQPRPASQMSTSSKSGTNYTLYGPYGPKGLAPAPSSQPPASGDRYGQEDEVDALTSLLVKSMDAASDPDFFGMCAGCGSKVVGEGTGCTAMGQVYHIRCFTCVVCCALLQGKPFYAVEGKPYCEEDYLNTLEKCCVCTAPILDRILRATGKPYHPQCFRCIMCGLCLDGIPFTVDAANQIHCIDDFHKKFAPRCSVCHLPIMPEPGQEETVRVVAMDRSFHVHCYKCEDCGTILSSEAEGRGCYPLDEHVLCKTCNARRVQALTSCVSTEL